MKMGRNVSMKFSMKIEIWGTIQNFDYKENRLKYSRFSFYK